MVDLGGDAPDSSAIFGQQLRRIREGAGLLIEDIVAETKVSSAIFEALENGRFKRLPEPVFSRSFVAQYARTVGVDEAPLLEAFDRAWNEYCETEGIATVVAPVDEDLRPSIRWRFWIPIATGIAILLIAAAVILRGSTSLDDRLAPDPRRSGVNRTSEDPASRSTSRPTPRLTPVVREEAHQPESVVELSVGVEPGEECWIHFRDRDGVTGQRLLGGGGRLDLELAGPVKLTIGNAGAATLTIGGTSYRELGLPGQVIHTEVTPSGFTRLVPGDAGRS